ncbi:hypothetical protein HKX48_009535, partial [Thoreauomyces humboldtii]
MDDTNSVGDCNALTDYISNDFETSVVVIVGIASALLHVFLLILFSDRLAGVKHRGTRAWFFVVVGSDILNSANYAVGTIQLLLYIPILCQFCLELANQLYGAILYSLTLDYEQSLYIAPLMWSAIGYRFLLDALMGAYSMSIVSQASTSDRNVGGKALVVAYAGRMALFLIVDGLEGFSLQVNDGNLDLEFNNLV